MGWLQILLVFIAAVLFNSLRSNQKERRFQKFAAENGCKPPYREESLLPWGISRFYEMMKTIHDGGDILEDIVVKRFFENGKMTREGTGLLGKLSLNTIDPRNIQTVMALKFKDFEVGKRRHRAFRPLLGTGIFTTDGPFWEHSRALFRPQFARENVNDLVSTEYNVQALLKVIPVDGDGWTPEVDLLEHFYRLTLDEATASFFNDNINSQLAAAGMAPISSGSTTTLAAEKEEGEMDFAEAFNIAQDGLAWRFQLSGFYWLGNGSKFRKACRKAKNFVDAAVRRALSSGKSHQSESGYSILDSLLRETQDATELRDQCLALLLAGRDTTAALLGWLFTMFIVHPHVFQKLRAVILEEFDPNDLHGINFASLKGCRYLQYVINETLRLYNPVPLNSRVALRDTILPSGGGPDQKEPVAIRKGQEVLFSPYAMHRRADIWGSDVLEFKPERWVGRKSDWSYLAFGGGPRVCLGRK
ncbi:MAG: hypothetical protein M1822_008633 [Bathelium mastoideum]|nr:MAG: hypothetical protein M1822_008633 [Bathelium mastoideum]